MDVKCGYFFVFKYYVELDSSYDNFMLFVIFMIINVVCDDCDSCVVGEIELCVLVEILVYYYLVELNFSYDN